MTKRALTILIAAVLLVGAAAAVIAVSVTGDSGGPQGHSMPGGQTMEGSMPSTTNEMKEGPAMEGMNH